LSPREDATIEGLHFFLIPGTPSNPALMNRAEQDHLRANERQKLSAAGSGDALTASNNPPLYYGIEAVPYLLSPSQSVLDRLWLMRVVSSLLSGLTVLCIFLFLRELLPGTPWAWTIGALGAALEPLFGFISGALNSDTLIYLTSAATFLLLARAFRRGLDRRRGLALGACISAALLSKFTLIGFLPGVGLGFLLLIWRARDRREAALGAALAVVLAALPTIVYLALSGRSLTPGGIGSVGSSPNTGLTFSLRGELVHIWELYLPRLPFMRSQFGFPLPLWHTWFRGFFGVLGWLDYSFSNAIFIAVLVVFVAVVAGAVTHVAQQRGVLTLRRHGAALVVYLVMFAGLLGEIGVQSYRTYISGGGQFEQARYLLPMLPFYALLIALAVRAGGRRYGPPLGAALVMAALALDLFAQTMTIGRYYT
jgi:4-amino-4-deoxy-L-arabinose transferase-like glycosyltransferase